jgi:hypothetical protein
MPTNYQIIFDAIDNKKCISGNCFGEPTSDPRQLVPYCIGNSEIPDSVPPQNRKMVLCYQYGGYSKQPIDASHPSPKNWRCLKVESFESLSTVNCPTISLFTMTGRHRHRQNCVQDIENYRRPPGP